MQEPQLQHQLDDNGKIIPWTRIIRDRLIDNQTINVSELSEEMYGQNHSLLKTRVRAQITSQRKVLERLTGRYLVCKNGEYLLLNRGPEYRGHDSLASAGQERRTQSSISYIDSFFAGGNIILQSYPSKAAQIRDYASDILMKALTVERALKQGASNSPEGISKKNP